MLMGVIGWILLGLIIGFLASKLVNLRGDDPGLGILVGAVASVIGGWLYGAISGAGVSAFDVWSLLFAGVGAVVALLIWHAMRHRAAYRT